VHVHEGVADTFSQRDGLSGDVVLAIFEDREGSIWVATGDGLDRFRESAIVSYSVNQGLSNDRVSSVLAASDGSVWVGTGDGLNRWSNGRMRESHVVGLARNVHSMFEDSQRRVWVATDRAVGRIENGQFVSLNGVPGVVTRAILEDSRKTLWIARVDHGLFGLVRGRPDLERIGWDVTKRKDLVSALAADSAGEGLWLGFFGGGIPYLVGNEVRASYAASDGLAAGRVSALHVDRTGTLWVAADGGLSRLKNGRLSTLTSGNGLPCEAVGWAIEDAADSLWLGMACGLVRIARTDIDAWAAAADAGAAVTGVTPRLEVALFDHADGVRTYVNASYYSAPVVRAADGKLWFVSQDGVSVVDPARLPVNTLPAPVHIEQVVADRNAYRVDRDTPLQLPPLVRDLQIDYTALSLVAPERVRFRYRLDGQDGDWQDVGTRRQAFYTDLRPGTYRFRVTASNNSGVWNDTGASVAFSIAPAYHQTNWFLALSIAMLLAAVWAAHRVRLRVVERHQREITALNERMMKAQEQERIRIAGELHDGVMQQMLAATMMLGMAKRRITDDEDAKATIDKVQQKLVQAGTDIRQLSHDLHPPALQDAGLPQAVTAYCEEFSATCGIPVKCSADDDTGELSRGAALALFRILQEALGNASKHAHAHRITVVLTRRDNVVSLTVVDDGAGFDATRLGTSGGLGLIMMRERASQLNGTFTFASAPGRGTTISVVIPFR
jgi:signal transduction histidine kinase/ligand-binding sensor domain-containing protein